MVQFWLILSETTPQIKQDPSNLVSVCWWWLLLVLVVVGVVGDGGWSLVGIICRFSVNPPADQPLVSIPQFPNSISSFPTHLLIFWEPGRNGREGRGREPKQALNKALLRTYLDSLPLPSPPALMTLSLSLGCLHAVRPRPHFGQGPPQPPTQSERARGPSRACRGAQDMLKEQSARTRK